MTDLHKIESFVRLFGLQDLDGDGQYLKDRDKRIIDQLWEQGRKAEFYSALSMREIGWMPDDLYQELDAMDDRQGNGFNRSDISKYISNNGIKGLSRFYPLYSLRYEDSCRCVTVNFHLPFLKDDIPYDNEDLGRVLARTPISPETLELAGAQVTHVGNSDSEPVLIGIEDVHREMPHAKLFLSVVDELMVNRNRIAIFYEGQGGPVVYGEKFAKYEWEELRKTLFSSLDPVVFEGDPDAGQLIAAAKLMRRAKESMSLERLESLEYDTLNEEFGVNPDFKDVIATLSPVLYLKVVYGERVVILNTESDWPIDGLVIDTGEEFMTSDAPQDLLREFTVRFDAIDRARSIYGPQNADPTMLIYPAFSTSIRFKDWLDGRSRKWARNVKSLLLSPEIDLLIDWPPTIVLLGGASHMPLLSEELDGFISTIFLKPKSSI